MKKWVLFCIFFVAVSKLLPVDRTLSMRSPRILRGKTIQDVICTFGCKEGTLKIEKIKNPYREPVPAFAWKITGLKPGSARFTVRYITRGKGSFYYIEVVE